MGICLAFGFAFQRWADGFGDRQQGGIDHIGGRSWTAVARVDELDRSARRGQSNDSQLEQAFSFVHLGFFQAHAIAFKPRKTSSMRHLRRYSRMISPAAAASPTAIVVNRRQHSGSSLSGGLMSRTSISVIDTVSGALLANPLRGPLSVTGP